MPRRSRPKLGWRRVRKAVAWRAESRRGLRWLAALDASQRLGDAGTVAYSRAACAYRHTFGPVVLYDTRPTMWPIAWYEQMVDEVFAPHVALLPGDTVIDVGAGVGTEAIVFARRVAPSGTVVAIEGHPETFRLLTLNADPTIVAIQAAAGEATGTVVFTDLRAHEKNYAVPDGSAEGVVVDVVRLDDLPAVRACGRVKLLKMNIEGSETAALRGAPELLARTDAVSISCHDFKAEREGIGWMRTRAEVEELLVGAGFRVRPAATEGPGWLTDTLHGVR